MTAAQAAAWGNYASGQTKSDPRTGKSYHPTGITAFTALASKFLQVSPAGTIPLTPPTTSFAGDPPVITATGGAAKVTFNSGSINAANVTTELLLQPLKSANRKPQPGGYRTKAFQVFVNGGLSAIVTIPAGWYVPAYRFVNILTGQDVGMVILPAVQAS